MSSEAVIKLVFGMRGCGKTVKVRNLVEDTRRLLIVDTLGGDYTDGVTFRSLDDLAAFWLDCYQGGFI